MADIQRLGARLVEARVPDATANTFPQISLDFVLSHYISIGVDLAWPCEQNGYAWPYRRAELIDQPIVHIKVDRHSAIAPKECFAIRPRQDRPRSANRKTALLRHAAICQKMLGAILGHSPTC